MLVNEEKFLMGLAPGVFPDMKDNLKPEGFQYLLSNAFMYSGLFSKQGKYNLKATLIALEGPVFGIGSTKAMVNYVVHDEATGAIIFDETIESLGEVRFSDSWIYEERLQKASVQALLSNISLFLKKISR